MKTCFCNKEYNYISPVYVTRGIIGNESEDDYLYKVNNFCSVNCMKNYIDNQSITECEYIKGVVPLEERVAE